jgi:hypothetical protein
VILCRVPRPVASLTLQCAPWILQREMNAIHENTNRRWWWRHFQEWGRAR